jgi:hypothetical protein
LFQQQNEAEVMQAVEAFEAHQHQFQPELLRSHAEQFNPKVFHERYLMYLEHSYQEFRTKFLV